MSALYTASRSERLPLDAGVSFPLWGPQENNLNSKKVLLAAWREEGEACRGSLSMLFGAELACCRAEYWPSSPKALTSLGCFYAVFFMQAHTSWYVVKRPGREQCVGSGDRLPLSIDWVLGGG